MPGRRGVRRQEPPARYVVNCAGLFADEVSRIFGAEDYSIKGRKGEYYLLDKLTRAKPDRVVFPVPTPISKGMLIVPTVEGTVLIGPTACAFEDKEDAATTRERLEAILRSARNMIPDISETDVITSFAGIRPTLGQDFYIDASAKAPAFIQVAGIPIARSHREPRDRRVRERPAQEGRARPRGKGRVGSRRRQEAPRQGPVAFELDALVAEDRAYGEVVCRCERVTEAEIVAAIRRGHSTLDGIKYFTRAQMGRCQGGFARTRY